MVHVPYKGAGATIGALMAGEIQLMFGTPTLGLPLIKAGKARAIALSSASRLADYPDVPTLRESGFPDLVATVWFSLSGPAGMPADVVNKLNAEVRRILALPDVRERLRPEGIEPANLDAAAFTAFVAAELKRWAPVVKASGAKAD
jgi:tripartite-type tricarboxylate transporter receptor subunit TctC